MSTPTGIAELNLVDHHWSTFSNCLRVDPDVMFPGEKNEKAIVAAKAVCLGDGASRPACPVIQQCYAEHLKAGDKYGVWGGLTEEERTQLEARRARRRANHAA
jgi:WhiB family redox-sensing transcriptional regulator